MFHFDGVGDIRPLQDEIFNLYPESMGMTAFRKKLMLEEYNIVIDEEPLAECYLVMKIYPDEIQFMFDPFFYI